MEISPAWEFVADRVMGGVSTGALSEVEIDGRRAARLTGRVSLENNGGFIQMAAELGGGDGVLDASSWAGFEMDVTGNGQAYELRLRTDLLTHPWQSYRTGFVAQPGWRRLRFAFSDFVPNRTETDFDPARLRRVGVLAYGREFDAEVAVAGLRLFRASAARRP